MGQRNSRSKKHVEDCRNVNEPDQCTKENTTNREKTSAGRKRWWKVFHPFSRKNPAKLSSHEALVDQTGPEQHPSYDPLVDHSRDDEIRSDQLQTAHTDTAAVISDSCDDLKALQQNSRALTAVETHDQQDTESDPVQNTQTSKNLSEDLKADQSSTDLTIERKDQLEQSTSRPHVHDTPESSLSLSKTRSQLTSVPSSDLKADQNSTDLASERKDQLEQGTSQLHFHNTPENPTDDFVSPTEANELDNDGKVEMKEPKAPKCFIGLNRAKMNRLHGKTGDISSHYEMGEKLGEGSYGDVYGGIRKADGLNVALKVVAKEERMPCLSIRGYPKPLPLEIALMLLVQKGPSVPQFIKLLEWYDEPERYIMVLERPMPCVDMFKYVQQHGGQIDEEMARHVMRQVVIAACECSQRGVLHRDIKLENLLLNTETREVKLIDFGCGDRLRRFSYTNFVGTEQYAAPEASKGKYHAEPITVWSLGVLMFVMLYGRYLDQRDRLCMDANIWCDNMLSEECCDLMCQLLQFKPKKRLQLKKILSHQWFQVTA